MGLQARLMSQALRKLTATISKSMTCVIFINQIMGKKMIVTTKSRTVDKKYLVPFGQVWFYTDPQYLGRFYVLNSTKLYMDKIADVIRWKAWEIVALGIGNVNSISKLEFGTGVGIVPGDDLP